jgi:hypothetical protein
LTQGPARLHDAPSSARLQAGQSPLLSTPPLCAAPQDDATRPCRRRHHTAPTDHLHRPKASSPPARRVLSTAPRLLAGTS